MIKVKNLGKTYNGKVKAVSDISFDVNDGEIFAFIGHNGAGKTTLIKSIVGIHDFDEGDIPEKKVVQIGEFKIGMIHGHQVLPWGDLDALTNVQRELGCDILLSGHTHQIGVKVKEKKFYINPGSISGAFSHLIADPNPSFILMILQGEEAIVYLYVLNDKSQKFELSKIEFSKGASEYKIVKDEEENEEEEEEEDDKKEKQSENKKEEEPKEEIKEESNKEN